MQQVWPGEPADLGHRQRATHFCYIDSQVPGALPPARLAERIPPQGDRVGVDAGVGN
jgi:hypothetical protein